MHPSKNDLTVLPSPSAKRVGICPGKHDIPVKIAVTALKPIAFFTPNSARPSLFFGTLFSPEPDKRVSAPATRGKATRALYGRMANT